VFNDDNHPPISEEYVIENENVDFEPDRDEDITILDPIVISNTFPESAGSALQTVNVVVVKKGMAFEIFSFRDDDEGNELAEKQFVDSCSQHVSNWNSFSADDIDRCIEDGYCQYGQGYIQLMHTP